MSVEVTAAVNWPMEKAPMDFVTVEDMSLVLDMCASGKPDYDADTIQDGELQWAQKDQEGVFSIYNVSENLSSDKKTEMYFANLAFCSRIRLSIQRPQRSEDDD